MKHGLILLLLVLLPMLSFGQQQVSDSVKKVAILPVVDKEGSVSLIIKLGLIQSIKAAITNTPGYRAFNSDGLDDLMKEEERFQHSGNVSDSTRRKIGEISGATLILITKVAADANREHVLITAEILNVESGEIDRASKPYYSSMNDFDEACNNVVVDLFGHPASSDIATSEPKQHQVNKPIADIRPQPTATSGFAGYVELMNIFNLEGNLFSTGLSVSFGKEWNNRFYLGGGINAYEINNWYTYEYYNSYNSDDNNYFSIWPGKTLITDAFVDIRYKFLKNSKVTPFIGLKTGLGMDWWNGFHYPTNVSVGAVFRLKRQNELLLNAELVQAGEFDDIGISLNLGYKFGKVKAAEPVLPTEVVKKKKRRTFSGYIEQMNIFNFNGPMYSTGMNLSFGAEFNGRLYLGGGTSIYYLNNWRIYDVHEDWANVRVFNISFYKNLVTDLIFDVKYKFLKDSKVTPIIGFKTGVGVDRDWHGGNLDLHFPRNLSLGVAFRLKGSNELMLNAEYVHGNWWKCHGVSLNVGYKFGQKQ